MDERKYKSDLWSQLKDAYGKVLYTYVTHQKHLWLISIKQSIIGWVQIVLTSVSAVGFLSIVITSKTELAWVAGVCSVVSLALNLYCRSANMSNDIIQRRKTIDALWPIVQDYLSLLTDFWNEESITIIKQSRHDLQDRTVSAYKHAPRTGWLAYKMAKRALEKDKEQSFDGDESDMFIPENLRGRK